MSFSLYIVSVLKERDYYSIWSKHLHIQHKIKIGHLFMMENNKCGNGQKAKQTKRIKSK